MDRDAAQKGFGIQLLDGVYDDMMQALQRATRACIDNAAKQFEAEFSQLQKKHKEEIECLRSELRKASESHGEISCCHSKHDKVAEPTEDISSQVAKNTRNRKERNVSQSCIEQAAIDNDLASNAPTSNHASPSKISIFMAPEDFSTSPERVTPCPLSVVSPRSMQRGSSNPEQNEPHRSTSSDPVVLREGNGQSPSQPCESMCCEPHGDSDINGEIQHKETPNGDFCDKTLRTPAKEELANSPIVELKTPAPLPIQPTPPSTPHQHQPFRKAKSDSNATLTAFAESPEALEPDTIEVLRAALVDDNPLGTPKTSKGSVILPPAAVLHARTSNTTAAESSFPTQGSPLARLAFETPRGSSPRQPVRTPRLSHIFNTPATSMQTPASAHDNGCIASPPSQPCEIKSRRLSWPTSSPKLRASSGKQREGGAVVSGDDATANTPCDESQAGTGTRFQAITNPTTASPKAKTDSDREGGSTEALAVQVVASPLRRRWLGVLNAVGQSSSTVVSRPPQRM